MNEHLEIILDSLEWRHRDLVFRLERRCSPAMRKILTEDKAKIEAAAASVRELAFDCGHTEEHYFDRDHTLAA